MKNWNIIKSEEKGITLIALIITIIILVILAAVSIRAVANMGIVGHAINGTQQYAESAKAENEMLGETVDLLENTLGKLNNIQNGNGSGENGAGGSGGSGAGNTPSSLQAGVRTTAKASYTSGEGANAKTAVIPAGFTVSKNTGEDEISEGLVIYRIPNDVTEEQIANINWETLKTASDVDLKTTYDQFVWIPIPKANINDMFMCQSKAASDTRCSIIVENGQAKCTKHNSTAMAGRLYADPSLNSGRLFAEIFNASLTTQTYTANSGLREPAIVTNANDGNGTSYDGAKSNPNPSIISGILEKDTDKYDTAAHFLDTLQNEYNAIVKSVYENEGFWVGRYETSGLNGTVKVVAGTTTGIENQNWYTMYGKQKKYAEDAGMLGGMIQGAAYDQVMKFVDGDTNFDVKSTKQVAHNLNTVYNTGSKSEDKGYNVYDLAGNVFEWTTEASDTNCRVYHGGNYNNVGSASCRYITFPTASSGLIGSRVTLYIR